MDVTAWWDKANCIGTDPEAFFAEKAAGDEFLSRAALKVCGQCEVRDECLSFALQENMQYGIWGGMRPTERDRFRRQWLKGRSA